MSFAPSPPFPEESRSLLHKGQYLQRSSYLQDHSYSFFFFLFIFFYFFFAFWEAGEGLVAQVDRWIHGSDNTAGGNSAEAGCRAGKALVKKACIAASPSASH